MAEFVQGRELCFLHLPPFEKCRIGDTNTDAWIPSTKPSAQSWCTPRRHLRGQHLSSDTLWQSTSRNLSAQPIKPGNAAIKIAISYPIRECH